MVVVLTIPNHDVRGSAVGHPQNHWVSYIATREDTPLATPRGQVRSTDVTHSVTISYNFGPPRSSPHTSV